MPLSGGLAKGRGSLATETGTPRRNLLPYPSFEVDSDSDGWADTEDRWGSISGWPAYSLPAGRTSARGQRLTYTSPSGTNKYFETQIGGTTAVGSYAPGEPATASVAIKGSASGCRVGLDICYLDAAGNDIDADVGYLSVTPDWSRASSTCSIAAPAGTSRVLVALLVDQIDAGDSFDLTLDDALLEKSSSAGSYFDGASAGARWDGAANASSSTLPGPGWRIDYLYDEEEELYGGVLSLPHRQRGADLLYDHHQRPRRCARAARRRR